MTGDQGSYLYLVARDVPADALTGVTGVSGEPVRQVPHDGLVAVVGTVDLAEFGEEGLSRNLEDLGWLEQVARSHDRVVQAVSAAGDAAPVRLATVCLDDDSVRAKLDHWRGDVERTLTRIHGRVEWGVKAYLDEPDDDTDGTRVESGTAYLERRRTAARRREEAAAMTVETADALHDRLAAFAVASRRHAAQDQRLSGHRGRMVLNGAYLVDDARSADLKELLGRLDEDHPDVRLELTGPWPTYSFAGMDMP